MTTAWRRDRADRRGSQDRGAAQTLTGKGCPDRDQFVRLKFGIGGRSGGRLSPAPSRLLTRHAVLAATTRSQRTCGHPAAEGLWWPRRAYSAFATKRREGRYVVGHSGLEPEAIGRMRSLSLSCRSFRESSPFARRPFRF